MSFGRKGLGAGAAPSGGSPAARPMERVLRRPVAEEAPAVEEPLLPEVVEIDRPPLLTYVFLMVFGVIFLAERMWGLGQASWTPSVATLAVLGGLAKPLVLEHGEWWRLISAAFLHGSVSHILFNGAALYMVGKLLEGLVGHAWFVALFFIGALGGSLMSLALNPPNIISVGASGAIMGLFGACLVCTFRLVQSDARRRIQMDLAKVLAAATLPIFLTLKTHVDYGAHLGGAVSGILAGMLILTTWSPTELLPRFRPAAAVVSAVGSLCAVFALVAVIWGYQGGAEDVALMPNNQVKNPGTLTKDEAAKLVKQFPRDPRAHLYYAVILLKSGNSSEAEEQLRQGLAEEKILATKFPPDLERRIRVLLAVTVAPRNAAEAKVVARPICAGSADAERTALAGLRLCD